MSNRPASVLAYLLITTLTLGVFAIAPQKAYAITCGAGSEIGVSGVCRGFLTAADASPWTVPNDWGNASNTIEVIGAGGGGGSAGGGAGNEAGGGGGGAYAKVQNLSFTPGVSTVVFQVVGTSTGGTGGGNGTTGSDTFFNGSGTTCADSSPSVCAKGGTGGGGTASPTGGAGGQAGSGVGSVKYSGGGGSGDAGTVGGGGGGAGGLNGFGATTTNSSTGGNADNEAGGAGGTANNPGSNGAEWSNTGSGGGAGGGSGSAAAGDFGGQYGGGGGGGDKNNSDGGDGAPGLIVITYVPIAAPTVVTDFASNVGATGATLNGGKTGGSAADQHGFAYSTDSTLSTSVTTTTLGALSSNTSFRSVIGFLTADQTYFFRAYATNTAGVGYGVTRSFITGNTTVTRKMRLFEGFTLKLLNGKVLVHQAQ